MESAELLDKGLCEGRIGLEVIELVWMLQKSDNPLEEGPKKSVKEEKSKLLKLLGGPRRTRLIMLTMVAFPATSIRNAIWVASDFSMCPGMSWIGNRRIS